MQGAGSVAQGLGVQRRRISASLRDRLLHWSEEGLLLAVRKFLERPLFLKQRQMTQKPNTLERGQAGVWQVPGALGSQCLRLVVTEAAQPEEEPTGVGGPGSRVLLGLPTPAGGVP